MQNTLQRKVRLLAITVLLSVVSQWSYGAFFIDRQLKDKSVLTTALKSSPGNVFHFLSHGKEGQLLVEGKWLNARQLVPVFSSYLKANPGTDHINIYGCEFGKGSEGRAAVTYLEKELGVSIAASDNITGKKGDWTLEIGKPVDAVSIANYSYNLQYAATDDFDGDGIVNSIDLDDDNDGILDTEECSDLGYTNYFGYKDDLMTAYCHGVIARTTTGYIAWGNVARPDGGNANGAPVVIGATPVYLTPANGYNYTGTILLATGGNQNQYGHSQSFLLTTTGLWAFGEVGGVIPSALTPTKAVTQINLPTDVEVSDVQKITATYYSFGLLTKSGDAYILGRNYYSYGDGSGAADANWHKVSIPKPLLNIKLASYGNIGFAQAADGTLYTWGRDVYLGDNTAAGTQTAPTEMNLPDGVSPAQIALGTVASAIDDFDVAYHVLGTNGKVYSLGYNGNGQMGNGSFSASVKQLEWISAKTSAGVELADIVFINANDNSGAANNSTVSAINEDETLYSWGYNESNTIGFPTATVRQVYATIPTGMSSGIVRYVENGYHITPVINSAGGICNVGHNAEGAFGDGTTSNRAAYECNSLRGGPYTLSAGLANACDLDGDGISNQFDLDSDGDGCPDSQEAGVVASFTGVEFSDVEVTNLAGDTYAENSQIASGTFVDANSNGFDDRLESVTTGVYSGTYTYDFALNPNSKNCVPTTQAVNDINQTPLNKTVTGNVLTNDIDKQGDVQTVTSVTALDVSGSPITIPLTNTPTAVYDEDHQLAGTLAISPSGVYTFVSQTGYVGLVPFSYTIADSKGAVDGAELLIKVLPELSPVQNPPIATNDVNKVKSGSSVVSNVLANDSDVDGDVLSVTVATGRNASGVPVNLTTTPVAVYDANNVLAGTASLNANGTISFTADVNFTGIVPINYTISDGTATDSAILTITVDPADGVNSIYANDDAKTGRKGTTQTGNVLTNDYDPEGDLQTITGGRTSSGSAITPETPVNLPSGGQFTFTTTGGYTYVPATDFVGTEVITYTTCDNGSPQACQTATLYLTTLINDAALPVTLLSFTAKNSVEGVQLLWKTANEFDFDRFVLEKNVNSVKAFKEVTTVKSGLSSYDYTDRSGEKGTNYYRLKMIDKDGSSAFSKIISVYLEYGDDEHVIFPNPTTDRSFYIHNYFKLDSYKVFNSGGKEVKVKLTEGETDYKFSLDKATAPGIYILQYKVGEQIIRRKLIVN